MSSFRQFGSWLDDASSSYRGDSYASFGVGYWRLAETNQIHAPMLVMGWGITDRMQVSASVPFYHTSYAGATASGVDDPIEEGGTRLALSGGVSIRFSAATATP